MAPFFNLAGVANLSHLWPNNEWPLPFLAIFIPHSREIGRGPFRASWFFKTIRQSLGNLELNSIMADYLSWFSELLTAVISPNPFFSIFKNICLDHHHHGWIHPQISVIYDCCDIDKNPLRFVTRPRPSLVFWEVAWCEGGHCGLALL